MLFWIASMRGRQQVLPPIRDSRQPERHLFRA